MKKALLFISILAPTFLFSQNTWQQVYGKDTASFSVTNSIVETSDGGFILFGTDSISAASDRDAYLVKTNSLGDTLWARSYSTSLKDYGQSAVESDNGGYLLVGTNFSTTWNSFIIKTDANGDTLWTRALGGSGDDELYAVCKTHDGGYVMTGSTNTGGAGNYDVILLKMDSLGNVVWSEAIGTLADEIGYSVQRTLDKGFIISGVAASPNMSLDALVIKTDSMGAVQWSNYYGTVLTEWAYDIKQTSDSGYVFTGFIDAAGTTDILLVRTAKDGTALWTKKYGDADYEKAYCVVPTADSGFAISGFVNSGSMGMGDAALLKTDSLGNLLFCHGFGGFANDMAPSLVETSDKGLALGAHSASLSGNYSNMYLVKTDSIGNTQGSCNQMNILLQTNSGLVPVNAFTVTTTTFTFSPGYSGMQISAGVEFFTPCSFLGESNHLADAFAIYPNPGTGIFYLSEIKGSSIDRIEVVNVLGETVFRSDVKNTTGDIQIDLSQLVPGTYIVQVRSGNQINRKKILLQE